MPQSEPVTILIVNEHAEEVKHATISLRGFFPECRIDVAYSAEEATAFTLATAHEWAIVLLEDTCLTDEPATFVGGLKRHAPYAAILLQSAYTDASSALRALQAGADYFLSKHSPAFLTELLFCTNQAVEMGELRRTADRREIRHHQLVDSLDGVFYELDAEGQFLNVSANLPSLLGYRPEELIGRPYHFLFSRTEQESANFRFNERRSGARAVPPVELTFQGKRPADGTIVPVAAEVSARGLYDPSRRFLGTIGIIRDLSGRKQQARMIQEMRQQLQQAEQLRALARRIVTLSEDLQQPLSTMLKESRLLFDTLREARVVDRMESFTEHAATATQLGKQLKDLLREASQSGTTVTINRLLEDALALTISELGDERNILTDFSASLPTYKGDPERTVRLFHRLLIYATTYLEALGRSPILVVRTRATGSSSVDTPTLFPLAQSDHIIIEIYESDRERPAPSTTPPVSKPIDLFELYQLAAGLGATLDVSAPAAGPLRLTIRLPIAIQQPIELPQQPVAETTIPPQVTEPSSFVPAHVPAARLSEAVMVDRRTQPRVSTTLPVHITIGSSTWEGTLSNVSLGGADIALPIDFPSIALQEAYIVVKTAVGILELTGLAYERTRQTTSPSAGSSESHSIIVFHSLRETEKAVLSSLIEAAREQSLTFTLEILLAAGPSGSQGTEPEEPPPDHDRRETLRVSLAIPVRLETARHREPAGRLIARMVNLSRNGACLLVQERPEHVEGTVSLHFPPPHRGDETGSHEPGAPDAVLPAEVVWSIAEQTAAQAYSPSGSSQEARIGVRFGRLTPYAEREVNRVIRQRVIAQWTSQALTTSASIISVPRECRNARGQVIAIVDDHLRHAADADTPTVILSPGFGQTAMDYAEFSYYLAAHHLRVLRYDHTNHVGTSEGELQHSTLRGLQQDLSKVVEFVGHTWPRSPILVIASDLAARAALKVAVQARPLDLLLLVNPSIDVATMLTAIHGHDLIADHRFGLRRGISNIFGLNVNLDLFVGDLIAGHYTDLGSTLDDLRLVKSALVIVTTPAQASTALPPADLPHAFMTALGPKTRLVNLPTSLTDQSFSAQQAPPPAFKRILELIVSVLPDPASKFEQEVTFLPQLSREQRIEHEYTGLRHGCSQVTREALWAAHLAQLPQLGNLHEYRKLLDDLYNLMSPLEPGAILADAGIGQSDVTRTALVNFTYRAKQASWTGKPSPLMIGLGRSEETIGQARRAVEALQRELSTGFLGRLAAMPACTVGWVQADWTGSLPFKTGSLDRLVCNLSLSYVPSPLAALREWHRVLHPDGRLILTTFHPNTNFSTLYRRHLRQANQDEFSTNALPLLNYFGRLREAIRHRLLHTFDKAALSSLLRQAGMTSYRILPIFDGQALVAVFGKQNSSGSIQ